VTRAGETTTTTTTGDLRADRIYGATLAAASLLSIGFMLRHPSVGAKTLADALDEIVRKSATNGIVHGALIALTALVFFALLGLADRLGARRAPVRLGVVAAAVGTLTTVGAAIVNGFVVSGLAAYYAGKPQEGDVARGLLTFCHLGNQALARVGVVAIFAAIAGMSLAMFRRSAGARIVAAVGLLAAATVAPAVAAGLLPLNVHGMLLVVAAQAAFNVATGVLLFRGRL